MVDDKTMGKDDKDKMNATLRRMLYTPPKSHKGSLTSKPAPRKDDAEFEARRRPGSSKRKGVALLLRLSLDGLEDSRGLTALSSLDGDKFPNLRVSADFTAY